MRPRDTTVEWPTHRSKARKRRRMRARRARAIYARRAAGLPVFWWERAYRRTLLRDMAAEGGRRD